MLTLGTDTSGGWSSINNILFPQSAPKDVASDFFPAPQRTKIESNQVAPAGGSGQTFRQTDSEGQSIYETVSMAMHGWLSTPYEQQYSVPAKVNESKNLADVVSQKEPATFTESLSWALEQTRNIATLFEEIKTSADAPRDTVVGTPRAGYPEGRDEQNLNNNINRGADTAQQLLSMGGQFYDQVKGLFSTGYDQYMKQPVASAGGQALPVATLIVIAIIIYIVVKK